MSIYSAGYAGNVVGRANAAADTVYYAVVPGFGAVGTSTLNWRYTRLSQLSWTSGNTANAFTVMRPLASAKVTVAAITNVAALTLDADPSPSGNTIAASDSVVVQHTDGTYRRYNVNTAGWCSTTNTVTFNTNLAANVAVNAKVWNFGVFTDTDPVYGTAHPTFPTVANTTNTYVFSGGGVCGSAVGDPLLIYNPNATNATVMNFAEFVRTVN